MKPTFPTSPTLPIIMKSCVLFAAALLSTAPAVTADTIKLAATDVDGQSSFASGTNWTDENAPQKGNDYSVTGYQLRTPVSSDSYTFAGDSLTLLSSARLIYKGTGTNSIITVENLVLAGGRVTNWQSGTTGFRLAGNINITTTGHFDVGNNYGAMIVSARITGDGVLQVNGNAAPATAGLVLANTNTWTGGTIIKTNAFVTAQADGAFGGGDVAVEAGGRLKFESAGGGGGGDGTTHSYIASSANLLLSSELPAGSIILNYTGTNSIAGLSFDGGATFAAAGTWGATGNPLADHTSALLTGTGLLYVIPEPGTSALATGGVVLALAAAAAATRLGASAPRR